MRYYDYYDGPHGRMLLVARDEGMAGVYFADQKHHPTVEVAWQHDASHVALRRAKRELAEYFGGARQRFEIALAPEGTPFQLAVWKAIAGVDFGRTITYGELARRAGHPGCARAAGAATGRNPIGIIVPCHRIVGADGNLTGYAGGLERKRMLLALEGADPALTLGFDAVRDLGDQPPAPNVRGSLCLGQAR
jgi:methylated-DNA-[protein]-cysteine S-methyltransferase